MHEQFCTDTDARAEDEEFGQLAHALAPAIDEYVPEGQLVHTTDELDPATPEYVPVMQLTHTLAPAIDEYDPALQFAHALIPDTPENVPTGQFTHAAAALAPACAEYVPVPQLTHTAEEFAPGTAEYDPAGHDTHALEPDTFLYCPAAHGEHRPPFGPVYPALHVQLLRNPLLTPANEFAGHKLQLGLPSGDHCPNGQLRHVSFPTAP